MTRVAVVSNAPVARPIGQDPSLVPGEESRASRVPDASEVGVVAQATAVRAMLESAGYDAPACAVRELTALSDFLIRERPDAVFNCCESLLGRADLEMCLAGAFELHGVPYTGSTPLTLGLGLHKGLTKAVLRAQGVPTADYSVIASVAALDGLPALHWPLLVKPLAEDASIGIDETAVVYDATMLRRRVEFLIEALGAPVIVEEFVDGREFMVALLATSAAAWTVLPVEEVRFDGYPPGHPRILTYAAKWLPESVAYRASAVSWPDLPPGLVDRLRNVAMAAAQAIGLRDYGRVDVRVSDDGRISVLEVNPNPDIGPESGFMATARVAGLSPQEVVTSIARRALERRRPPAPTA